MIRRKGTFAGRVLVAALFLMGVAASVNAYTIVMRDGRRVEIPDTFTVSDSTLTYEVRSGIQVTVQLNTVDIAATERLNGGSPGSLLQRATSPPAKASSPNQTQPRANRSITNKELESYRRARVESEEAYEKTRQELGLPSFEERRKELQAIEDRTVEQVRNMRARQAEIDEAYWRGRAEALSSQGAASQAQVDFARTQVVDGPWAFPTGAGFFPFGTVGSPFGDRRFGRFPFTGFPSVPQFPPFGLTPVFGPFNRVPFRPRIFIAPGTRTHRVHSRPMGGRRR
ncbi:MAG TPA: hypothetical protein VGW58_18025 [Pyrinomonadaceae bacterium]|nr:hypothetical protein [Pyrinomonadaceae bacterium]